MVVVLLLLTGWIAGTVGSLIGLGGGIITVPVLLYLSSATRLMDISPQVIVATSLVVIVITALSSTISYTRQGKIDYRSGLLFAVGSCPGAVLGVWINQYLHTDQFVLYFGLFLLIAAGLLILKLKPVVSSATRTSFISLPLTFSKTYTDQQTGEESIYGYSLLSALLVSFCVGVVSSLFGVGGGILMVPAMLLLFRFPPQAATATSMFIVLLTAMLGSVTNLFYDNIHWIYALVLAPGAWLGGITGARLSRSIKGANLKYICAAVFALVGLRMVLQG